MLRRRIKHHLRHNPWRPECSVVMVSYQAAGPWDVGSWTRRSRIHGESVRVEAEIHSIEGFSAHADQGELMDWVKAFPVPPKRIYLVHGERKAQDALARRIREELGLDVHIPALDQTVELAPARVRTVRAGRELPVEPWDNRLWEAFAELRDALDQLERRGAPAETMEAVIAALEEVRQKALAV